MVQDEKSQEKSEESKQDVPDEKPEETEKQSQEQSEEKTENPGIIKHDLGDGLHYYEEDGICYIDLDRDDEVIDEVRAKIIKASEIREFIRNGEFEKIKPYVPEDAYSVLYTEYMRWLNSNPRELTEEEKKALEDKKTKIRDEINEIRTRIENDRKEREELDKIIFGNAGHQAKKCSIRRKKALIREEKELGKRLIQLQRQPH